MSEIGKLTEDSFFFKWLLEQKESCLFNYQTFTLACDKDNFEVLTHAAVPSENKPEDFVFLSKDEVLEFPQAIKNSPKRSERYAQRNERFSKDKTFNPKIQKKNRNVLSNLVHHLLKFLANREFVLSFVERTVKNHHLGISVEECFEFFNWMEDKLKSYVTEKCLKDFCFGNFGEKTLKLGFEFNMEYAKLFRILCCRFYRLESISSILLSSKLSQESKLLHIKGLRDVQEILLSISGIEN